MLERMIMDRAQLQAAQDMGLRVDDEQLDQAITRIAANNKLTVPQFKAVLEKDKIPLRPFPGRNPRGNHHQPPARTGSG